MQFRGCGTALVTPFKQDGSIDETALRNLVAWQVESGIALSISSRTTYRNSCSGSMTRLQRSQV